MQVRLALLLYLFSAPFLLPSWQARRLNKEIGLTEQPLQHGQPDVVGPREAALDVHGAQAEAVDATSVITSVIETSSMSCATIAAARLARPRALRRRWGDVLVHEPESAAQQPSSRRGAGLT